MKILLKKAGIHLSSFVIGTAVVGSCGALMLTDSSFHGNSRPVTAVTAKADTDTETVKPVEQEAADTTTAVEAFKYIEFKKAAIGDYDMATKKAAKSEKDKDKDDENDFKVEFPEDDTLIYLPEKGSPANFTSTRSIADEYYTVHDEISGSTVTLNGHELLCRMINNEIGDSWGEEAIKAQAVAGYCYLRFNESIGLTPTVGLKSGYSSKLENCVNAVEGQVMYYNGSIINGVYSASTAGYSTSAKDIWGVDYPYLRCVESEYDDQDPNWGLEKQYTKDEVKKMLEDKFSIELSDNVKNWFKVDRVFSVKYIDSLTIDGRDDCKITGNGLCNLVGLKSNALEISYKDGVFTFKSYGWGHGVGLSQWGACNYAKNGWTYDQILTHYYINTNLGLSDTCDSAVKRGVQINTSAASDDSKADSSTVTTAPAESSEKSEKSDESSQAVSETTEKTDTVAAAHDNDVQQ